MNIRTLTDQLSWPQPQTMTSKMNQLMEAELGQEIEGKVQTWAQSLVYTVEELECKICYNRYNTRSRKPKLLGCLHRVCAKCLKKMVDMDSSPTVISCPFCRHETYVPDEEVRRVSEEVRRVCEEVRRVCEKVRQVCEEVRRVCEEVRRVCEEVRRVCEEVRRVCEKVRRVCEEVRRVCEKVRQVCEEVRRVCEEVRRVCEEVRRVCEEVRRVCEEVRRVCEEVRRVCEEVRRVCEEVRRVCEEVRRVHNIRFEAGGGGLSITPVHVGTLSPCSVSPGVADGRRPAHHGGSVLSGQSPAGGIRS
ncbi:golgin subfamily A member 6-like protein 4 isoform X2 [Xiphophorus hellerii]|uniref:golgin subfamily A member 6-like protein 4 isoform X2 n=1 Tax=Xiphophorus hellerii TaxID=8084 RepID=UPI0013B35899|nr:golgin subfamily A member 6-like protein 4 isoform X2 [Xiphophorus hellerii]